MKFQIGDVVRLKDGIDYNGNSLTFMEGFDVEIIGYEEDRYHVRDFYRPVKENEIRDLVMPNAEKWEKYLKEFSLYNQIVFIRTGSLTFREVTIQYYGFRWHDFMYKGDTKNDKEYFRIGKYWLTLLDAYKECYEKLVCRMQEIREQSNITLL